MFVKPNAVVRIRGTQRYEGQEPETIELTTEGELYEKDGTVYLVYAESELTGLDGTFTTFAMWPDRVRLLRAGKVNSLMEFTVGKVDESLYDTGMGGALLVTIRTDCIENNMSVQGGMLRVSYKISIESCGSGQIDYELLATRI